MTYYFDIKKDDIIGTTGKMRILNSFINLCEMKRHICYPRLTINGEDMWGKYFEMNFDPSVYAISKELPCDGMAENQANCKDGFAQHIVFNTETKSRVDKIYNDIGNPEIAIYIRETDKSSDQEVVVSPIIYVNTIKTHYPNDKILVVSDCDYTLGILQETFPNIICLPNHRSKNFMPLHRFLKNKRNFNVETDDKILFDELMIDILLLTKVKTILYGTWSGLLAMVTLLTMGSINVIDIKKELPPIITDITQYYRTREMFLWKIIEEYYFGYIPSNTESEFFNK
jgi:hypothetical protein